MEQLGEDDMNEKPEGFKYARDNEEGDGSIYNLKIELPNDGVPDSNHWLLVEISTHENGPVDVGLWDVTKFKKHYIGSLETANKHGIAQLLYGAAKMRTIQRFEPV